jgi:sec-independent protein translocase protein TatA
MGHYWASNSPLIGGKKIPELMKGLGSGIKEFKDATKEEKNKEKE